MSAAQMVRGLVAALATHQVSAIGSQQRTASQILEQDSVDSSPIRKVITLIEEMKATVEKEGSMDLEAYDKYMCWCQTNDKEKNEAIKTAEARISELEAFIEESAAKEGQLKGEIADLASDLADSTEALETATAERAKQHEEFQGAEADMKETRGLLQQAVDTLSNVQLLQTGNSVARRAAKAVLSKVGGVVQTRFPKYQSVMQRDLFDVLGSLDEVAGPSAAAAFLGERAEARLLPWEKTEEQQGLEKKPNEQHGGVAGAKSYNSRSGRIVGILEEMHSQFTRDLTAAQKSDFSSEVAFQKLRAAKLSEIAVATETKERKEAELSDVMQKAAEAKEDKESTTAALSADEQFLMELTKGCKAESAEYNARTKVRNEEIRALAETLKILTSDQARDLYGKTVSFLQTQQMQRASASEERALDSALQRIAEVAQKNKNWRLAALAVRSKLDAFTKVKEAMDKMLVQLQKQQKDEYEQWEFCKQVIDTTEDKIKVAARLKEDLAGKHQELVNTIATLEADIATLKNEIADMEVSLKQAGEERHEANRLYQTSVADQRATIQVMQKALKRLEIFYNSQSLLQQPGRASSAPPPKPSGPEAVGYEKSAASGGVMQLLNKVIENAQAAEQELQTTEQQEQASYAEFVNVAKQSIEDDRASVTMKEGHVAENQAAKSETEEAQLANDADLTKLNELLQAHHTQCDYLIKYFDTRQTARQEEMNSIKDAKAILSGANFGR